MVSVKTAIFKAASLVMRGRHNGLSVAGQLLDRVARYIVFVGRAQRLEFHANASARRDDVREQYLKPPDPTTGIIYDVGANNGDDTEYYLKKGLRVVAIEANPVLADLLHVRFGDAIQQGRLTVINVAIGDKDLATKFYVNVNDDRISTVVEQVDRGHEWSEIEVNMTQLTTIISQHGPPLFLKLDIENAESMALKDLFSAGCFPDYISAEAHSAEILCLLVAAGYNQFKVVEGKFAHSGMRDIKAADGNMTHNFPKHSSGPFGDDLPGDWMNVEEVFEYFCEYGRGWKDIHACRN